MAKILLKLLDREQFAVSPRTLPSGKAVSLVTPTQKKHVWREDELHLRSLLVDADGRVISSGFPKFVNYGEIAAHDESFRESMRLHKAEPDRGHVSFPEKLDGTLIIADLIDGEPHFRTRGNHVLGAFEEPVMALFAEQYAGFLDWWRNEPFWFDQCSLLFEYVAPTNQIVVKYTEPALYFIGVMWKHNLHFIAPQGFVSQEITRFGFPLATEHTLATDPAEAVAQVSAWGEKEGVVATFVANERIRLLKIKAAEYVRLHGLKFKLEGNVGKLLFLTQSFSPEVAREKLFDLGIDHEAQAFVQGEIDTYFTKWDASAARWADLKSKAGWWKASGWTRKEYVEIVRRTYGTDRVLFNAAMLLFDDKTMGAMMTLFANDVLGESIHAVQAWQSKGVEGLFGHILKPAVDA